MDVNPSQAICDHFVEKLLVRQAKSRQTFNQQKLSALQHV